MRWRLREDGERRWEMEVGESDRRERLFMVDKTNYPSLQTMTRTTTNVIETRFQSSSQLNTFSVNYQWFWNERSSALQKTSVYQIVSLIAPNCLPYSANSTVVSSLLPSLALSDVRTDGPTD